MVRIVTGSIHSGKSQRLLQLYDAEKKGDGFVAVKRIIEGKVAGYDAMRLKTREQFPLVIKEDYLEEPFVTECQIGPYCFSRLAMETIFDVFDELIKQRVEPLYFDEIGLLELEGKGFDLLVRKLLSSGLSLVLVIRRDFLDGFLKRYQVKEFLIVS